MEGIKKIIKQKFPARNKNIHSEIHYWADTISRAFGERKKFALYLGVIKRIGIEETKRIFAEIRDTKANNPAKLFLWKSKKNDAKNCNNPLS